MTSDPVSVAVGQSGLDARDIERQARDVLDDALYWFPVRHHSPTTARYLQEAITRRKPKLVLIEGPSEADHLIPFVVDPQTKPPVAIYSSFRDDDNRLGLAGIESGSPDVPPRFGVWYPLMAYSPEYVAMKTARKLGVVVHFIDLPNHALIKPAKERGAEPAPNETSNEGSGRPGTLEFESDRLLAESDFYRRLAEVGGFQSWQEGWDALFELHRPERSVEDFRRDLATFCAAARATSPRELWQVDGTLERERFMHREIARRMKEHAVKPEETMVVCGGFHLFLDRNDATAPPEPPVGTTYSTVAPYSFFRVSELSGYGAGNRAPRYYQTLWEHEKGVERDEALLTHVTDTLRRARRDGEPLSSADAIAVVQTAKMLAALRARQQPVLDDLHDALVTCCCKGDPERDGVHLTRAMDAVDIGTKVGRVTPKLGHLPLVNDFYGQLDSLGLDDVAGKDRMSRVELDTREPLDARRSAFLHRLTFLEVPIGAREKAVDSEFATGTLFKETWALKWSPKIEAQLIERNLYGDTVEVAALALLEERLALERERADATSQRLVQAIDMDFPNLVLRVEQACGEAIDTEDRFASLGHALGNLLVLDRYATLRGLRRDHVRELIRRAFDRACFALPSATQVPDEQQPQVIEALLGVAEALQQRQRSDDERLDRDLFVESVRRAASAATVPYMQGVFLGLLTELRDIAPDVLARRLAQYAQQPLEKMILAGEFLDGVMTVSRTSIMLGADALVNALDALLKSASWEPFLSMLPKLRSAFERLHARHRDAFAGRVATSYGLAESEQLTELNTTLAAATLIADIDQQVAAIMKDWSFG